MKTYAAWTLAALVAISGATAYFTSAGKGTQEGASETKAAASTAPGFNLLTVPEKGSIKLSDYQGKVVLVNFWATWCPPCRAEIPDFIEVRNSHSAKGFEIIGISLDEGGAHDVVPFAQEFGITYPLALGNQDVVNRYGGLRGIPTSFLINRQGQIVQKWPGMIDKSTLEQAVKALL